LVRFLARVGVREVSETEVVLEEVDDLVGLDLRVLEERVDRWRAWSSWLRT
jgi:hypothetical protein